MIRPMFIAAAMAATALTSAGFAAQTTSRPLTRIDANGDGNISRAEFLAQAATRFARLDADKNGVLSGNELRFGRGPARFAGGGQDGPPPGAGRMGTMLDQLDTDHDGKITKAEFAAQSSERFASIDTNKDGKITADELAQAGPGGRMFGRADADGDGTITRAEFDAQSAQRFARLDANNDGVIDATERAAMRGPGGPGGPGRGRPGGDMPPPPPSN